MLYVPFHARRLESSWGWVKNHPHVWLAMRKLNYLEKFHKFFFLVGLTFFLVVVVCAGSHRLHLNHAAILAGSSLLFWTCRKNSWGAKLESEEKLMWRQDGKAQISDWLLFQQILHNIFGERDIFSGVCSYFGDECALIMHRVHIRVANRWIGTNASDARGSIRRTEVLISSQKWWWLPLAIKGSSTLVKPFFVHGNPSSFMETSFAHEGAGEEREVLNDYLWQQCKFECEKH